MTEDDVLGEFFEAISEATDQVAVRTALQEAGIDSADASFVPTMLHAGGKFQDLMERTVVRCAEGHVSSTFSMIFLVNDSVEKVGGWFSRFRT